MSPTPEAESPAFAIVHQSAVACAQIARVLRDLGYGVVATGSDVADVLVSGANAVIVDGRMERLAGRIAELRAAKPDAKILVLASLEEIALVRTAVAAGAHGAIRRPPLRSRMEEALAAGIFARVRTLSAAVVRDRFRRGAQRAPACRRAEAGAAAGGRMRYTSPS